MIRRFIVLAAAVLASLVIATPLSASAATPPCMPGAGPCNQTDHFTAGAFPGMPIPGCTLPAVWIEWSGNEVQHINVNSNQDFWFTSTTEGAATISLLKVTSVNGVPTFGPGAPFGTGHLATWFGISANNQNYVLHDTGNLVGTTVAGAPISLHFLDHFSSIPPNSIPAPNFANAHNVTMHLVC
jgi:hypothetical protein